MHALSQTTTFTLLCHLTWQHHAGRAKDLHNFRLLQRRFIVYRPKKAAGRSCATPGDPSHPITQSGQPCAAADQSQAGHAVSDQSAGEAHHIHQIVCSGLPCFVCILHLRPPSWKAHESSTYGAFVPAQMHLRQPQGALFSSGNDEASQRTINTLFSVSAPVLSRF